VTGAVDRLISVAPMMDCTDRHCRFFLRLLAPDVRLYTEMITAQAIINGDRDRLLGYHPSEKPLSLQLGGNQPNELAKAVTVAAAYGYDEYNLNIGCPSDRVQSGRFGACLMLEPARVADCVSALSDVTGCPVTVKTRIGVDDHDSYEFLADFVACVARAGCTVFILHARKALLSGLSPKQNRDIPPLRYETVYRLKRDFPDLTIILNGGIDNAASVGQHLEQVDGVMIGRKAYSDPLFLSTLQANYLCAISGRAAPPDPEAVVRAMAEYAESQIAGGARLHHITRHMLGLFNGRPGARRWRRYLSQQGNRTDADSRILRHSLTLLSAAV
jgi:tRNA-dihydrouridine synthase A